MGLHLFALLFSSFLLTSCFQKSSFGEKGLTVTEGDNDPGDSVDDDPIDTDNTGISNPIISPTGSTLNPASSFYPKISATVASNVRKVFVYINGCSNLASLKNGTVIDPNDGIDAALLKNTGLELDVSTMSSNTRIKIYLKTRKSDNSLSECIEKYTYAHNINSPINFLAFSTKANPSAGDWKTNSLFAGNVSNPLIKLQINNEDVDKVQLFRGTDSCNTSTCACEQDSQAITTKLSRDESSTGVALSLTQSTSPIKIFAKGFGVGSFTTSCKEIASYTIDTIAPNNITDLRLEAVSTHLKASPPISWTATDNTGGSGISHYLYYISENINGNAQATWTQTSNNNNLSLNISPDLKLNTTYYFFVKAVDRAGNESQTPARASWKVYKDSELPTFTITAPTGTISSQTAIASGTCIPGFNVKLSSDSIGVLPNTVSETPCNNTGTFNLSVKFTPLSDDANGLRTIKLTQFNGNEELPREQTITHSPLSSFGSELAAGAGHTCVVANSSAFCWGAGTLGQAGTSTIYQDATGKPKDVQAPLRITKGSTNSDFLKVTAGRTHSCGIMANKLAYCWGDNTQYQLANTSGSTATPQLIPTYKFKQLAAGGRHTCGIDENDRLFCWGDNQNLQLAIADTKIKKVAQPTNINVDVVTGFGAGNTKFVQVVAGDGHTCALVKKDGRTDTKTLCWGRNDKGMLGFVESITPTTADKGNHATPRIVSNEPFETDEFFRYLAAGAFHTCGITNTNKVYCWGWNNFGALGTGTTTSLFKPTADAINPEGVEFEKISVGGNHATPNQQTTCAISTTKKLYCWGSKDYGQVGNGAIANTTPITVPTPVSPSIDFDQVAVGDKHVCALTTSGALYCWGSKQNFRTGNVNAAEKQNTPLLINFGTLSSPQ